MDHQNSPAIDAMHAVDLAGIICPGRCDEGMPLTSMDVVDLVADSLRALCEDAQDADRVFWLMARAIDLHLAETLMDVRPRRWKAEALDAILSLVSEPLQRQVRLHLEASG